MNAPLNEVREETFAVAFIYAQQEYINTYHGLTIMMWIVI